MNVWTIGVAETAGKLKVGPVAGVGVKVGVNVLGGIGAQMNMALLRYKWRRDASSNNELGTGEGCWTHRVPAQAANITLYL